MRFPRRPKEKLVRWLTTSRQVLHRGARLGADLLYPPRCTACHAEFAPSPDGMENVFLCDACLPLLAPPDLVFCRRCSAPAIQALPSSEDCPYCRGEKFAWRRAVALGVYRSQLGKAIVQIKHPGHDALAMALGRVLAIRRENILRELGCDVVVPIPMHWIRRWRRGTNAPDLIAQVVADRLQLPCGKGSLVRRRLTPLQTESTLAQRKANQRRSFRVSPGFDFRGRRVLLVDDVLTSGATSHSAARVLRKAGAAEVCVAVLARAGIGTPLS